ncbi:M3 family metallopeptidase [Galactobacter valiniphilus]|uniref:M3 family metallopeptidase n=1 Tax=Galactobacter valiniphilus TaxID=2676122 RepID=UPI00373702B7
MSPVFTHPSPLPYELPALATITAQDLIDGVREGIAEQLANVEAIVADPAPASFENTFGALERSAPILRRAMGAAWNIIPSHGTAQMKDAELVISELGSAHEDALTLHPGLTRRLAEVDVSALEGEEARLAQQTLIRRRLAGAELDEAGRARLSELNDRISALSTRFGQRVSEDMNDAAVLLSAEEATGLSASALASSATAAQRAGLEGNLLTLILPSVQPALAELTDTASRERLHAASVSRGDASPGGTLELAVEIAALRAERAELLGYPHHAAATLATRSETRLERVEELLSRAVAPAVANAAAEDARIAELTGRPVTAWDRPAGLDAVAAQDFGVDAGALKDYFELDRVLNEGVFRAARLVYGLSFTPRPDLPVHHPDARVWEVFDEDGTGLGLFIGDFFARPTKRGGAWMNSLRDGASALGERPVVMNNLNIPQPPPGEPALCTLDEVTTLFHEFGHALHGLFSAAAYPSLAGTAIPTDIVEFPSQVNEMWAKHPEVLPHYAKHWSTGEALPTETLEALTAAAQWGEGFSTTEYLGAALLDLAWHTLPAGERVEDPLAFEDAALRAHGFDPEAIAPRYRSGYFQHIFESGYSAGYYSYFWAEVLDADTVAWFEEQPDVRAAGQRFREEFLSRGNTRDTLESFRAYRGRDADPAFLLRRRGLIQG